MPEKHGSIATLIYSNITYIIATPTPNVVSVRCVCPSHTNTQRGKAIPGIVLREGVRAWE